MRILIVDDEMVSRTKLELIMEYFGDCETVDHGDHALAAFHEAHRDDEPFNLIMLDINLPGMDGIRVLSAIRDAEKELNIEPSRKAKILMTTSYRDKDRIVASVQSGCDDYIGKPFDLNLIRTKLGKLGVKERGLSTDDRPDLWRSRIPSQPKSDKIAVTAQALHPVSRTDRPQGGFQ